MYLMVEITMKRMIKRRMCYEQSGIG
jgi:hypothetical protein